MRGTRSGGRGSCRAEDNQALPIGSRKGAENTEVMAVFVSGRASAKPKQHTEPKQHACGSAGASPSRIRPPEFAP